LVTVVPVGAIHVIVANSSTGVVEVVCVEDAVGALNVGVGAGGGAVVVIGVVGTIGFVQVVGAEAGQGVLIVIGAHDFADGVEVIGVDTSDGVVHSVGIVAVVGIVYMVGAGGGRIEVVATINVTRLVGLGLCKRRHPKSMTILLLGARTMGLTLYPVGTAKVEVEKASTAPRKTAVVSILSGLCLGRRV
jgi:hypothetical protein